MLDAIEKQEEQLKKFREDLEKDAEAVADQSAAANRDIRFTDVDGGMWEDWNEERFGNRTKLQFDRVSMQIQKFIGKWNTNRMSVTFKPDDSKASDEDAELQNGIFRADFRHYSGKLSVDNAVDEVAKCGYGAFRIGTVFDDEEDPANDLQRTEWSPIHNAYNRVFWSRRSKRIDKRDAPYVTEIESFTKEAFEEEYPGKNPVSAFDPIKVWSNGNWNMIQEDLIYVAIRREIIKKKETVFVYNNLQTGKVETYLKEDHEKEEARLKKSEVHVFLRERKIERQTVWRSVFSGEEFLEKPRRITGKWLPIIAVYGYRSFVDGVEWYRGITRKQMDPARLFNTMVSQTAEVASTSGQKIPFMDVDAIKGLESHYEDMQNKSYLPVRPQKDKDGKVTGNGLLGFYEPGQLDGNASAIFQLVQQFAQDTMGGAPQDTLDPNSSGKLFNAMIKQEDLATQPMMDNIANAIEWSGVVWDGIRQEIYTTSRIVRTIGKDGTEGRQQLGKAVIDEKTGLPTEENTLEGKRFRSYADVGPQFETQREQVVEDAKGIIDAVSKIPGAEQFILPLLFTIFDNIPGDGMQMIKDFNRKLMLVQGFVEPETDEEKQLVANANQPKEDPSKELVTAAANQANAEARQLDASAFDKVASAQKKIAETNKIRSETENARTGLLMNIRNMALEQANSGFIN